MADVLIRYDALNELNGSLKQIIVEFERAGDRSSALEDAIDRPYGKGRLRDEASSFESGWDDRRSALTEDLRTIQERVQKVLTGWADFDDRASRSLSVSVDEVSTLPSAK
ncbi:flagellar protein FlgN [Agromyces seonyuensis]|uniref:Flagellar protein FlgN n=1 Tax=Agromyces seonyuensis TaxID=2662446 RepID=A0A6I4NVC3_9MICO|nr:flagellar protein FlgN [Agromyces seonyuensis]MWB98203.1 flagellar protein FlgN [Agromyces seonyuensis]